MLEDVNKPGSDIEQYLLELDGVLEEKANSIREMKKAITDFHRLIEREKTLNEKVNNLRKKASPVSYNLDNYNR